MREKDSITTVADFKATLGQERPDASWHPILQALWFDGKEEWEAAHNIAQDIQTVDGSWIHAYLHRKEGDNANASYWYSRAGKKMPTHDLSEEWNQLVLHFLSR